MSSLTVEQNIDVVIAVNTFCSGGCPKQLIHVMHQSIKKNDETMSKSFPLNFFVEAFLRDIPIKFMIIYIFLAKHFSLRHDIQFASLYAIKWK